MKHPARLAAIALLGVGTCIGQTGCEDADAKTRAEVQTAVDEAADSLARLGSASVFEDEDVDKVKAELRKIVGALQGATGGSSGQESARTLLASNAQRELAALEAIAIHRGESAMADVRRIIYGKLAATMELTALADGLEAAGQGAERERLAQHLETARQATTSLEAELSELATPMNELAESTDAILDQVHALETQANDLRSEASSEGPRLGFPKFMQAKNLEFDASRLRYQAAERLLVLQHEMQPSHDLVEVMTGHARTQVEAMSASATDLERLDRETSDEVLEIRDLARQLWTQVGEGFSDLAARRDAIAANYSAVNDALTKAITNADASARQAGGSDGNPGKLAAARALAAQGRLAIVRTAALEQTTMLMDSGSNAAGLIGQPSPTSSTTALNEIRTASAEAAQTAIRQAIDKLGTVQGNASLAFRTALEDTLSALGGSTGGTSAPPMPLTMDPATGSGDASDLPAAVQDLVDRLRSIQGIRDYATVAGVFQPVATIEGVTPAIEQMAAVSASLDAKVGDLDTAVGEAFGSGSIAEGLVETGIAPEFRGVNDVVTGQIDATGGDLTLMFDDGSSAMVHITPIDGQWYIAGWGALTGQPFTTEGLAGIDPTHPEGREQLEEMGAMFMPMLEAMGQIFDDVISGVRAGSYESMDAVLADLGARAQALMGGGGG